MKTISIVLIIVLFLGLVGTILYLHYKVEKPLEENGNIQLINLSIFAQDENQNLVRTNYTIFIDGFYFGSGITNEYGAVLHKVPLNKSLTITNSNLEGQTFYKKNINLLTDKNETTRVVLNLISVGNLTVTHNISNYKINTTISSDGYFNSPVICLYWSVHVIFGEIENMTQIPTKENNTKCYQGITLDKSKYSFLIKYSSFGSVSENDFINVLFYDFDNNIYTLRKVYNIKGIK